MNKIRLNQSRRLLTLLLAAFLAVPVFGGASASAADSIDSSGIAKSAVSHFNYFNKVYEHLNDENHVFKTATYEDIAHLFESEGNYAVLFGGAWSEQTQATIGFINEVAKEQGIHTIYNFDTKLDGDSLQIADSSNPFAYKYVDLVNKYLKNLNLYDKNDPAYNVSYTKDGNTVAANKIEAPFLFVYNKDHKDEQGNPAPIVTYLDERRIWDDFLTDGQLDSNKVGAYKESVRTVFKAAQGYSTINESDYIKEAFNLNYAGENAGQTIFTEADGDLVYEHVTYHQLQQILQSEGNYLFLFGGSWCPNTQAVIKYINEYAKQQGIDKIYFWDTKLDGGLEVRESGNNTGGPRGDNPHGNETLQVRTTNHPYAKLYVDLVNSYLTNIKTQNNTAAKPTTISYVDGQGTVISGDRLQVPYLFAYNKDNKDADGQGAPILGHIELMYSWTNIQPDYVKEGDGYAVGARYNNYIKALESLHSRLEATPTGLNAIAPTTSANNDGQITGTTSALEYKLAGESEFKPVSGASITGLVPGTYQVRYASKPGYQGPTSKEGATAISYAPGQSVEVVVPAAKQDQEQDAPSGLKGIAPTTADNLDGQITGTTSAQEYKREGDSAYKPAVEGAITGLEPGLYAVRYAAREGFKASPDTLVEVPGFGEQAVPTGLIGVAPTTPANDDGKIVGTTTAMQYKLVSATDYVYATDIEVTGLVPGIYNVRYAEKEGYKASRPTDVEVPAYAAEQAAPAGLTGVAPTTSANNDGRINGTEPGQEYKLSGAAEYTAVTGTSITGLVPGTYQVRYAAKTGYHASRDTAVIVPAYAPAPGGGSNNGGGNNGGNGPGGGGSNSSSGSGSGGNTGTTAPTDSGKPAVTTNGNSVVVSITVKPVTDEATGSSTALASAAAVTSLKDSAKQAEAAGKTAVIEFKATAAAGTQTAQFTIPRKAFNELAAGTSAAVVINYEGIATITLDAGTIDKLSSAEESGDISILIAKAELTEEGKQALGDRPVYDFSIFAGDKSITSAGTGGKIKISIPYQPQAGETNNAIIVYRVSESGELEVLRGGFNPATGTVDVAVDDLSQLIIGYHKVAFADVAAESWYYPAIDYLAARNIASGVDDNNFSPNAKVTRGQFVVLLLKAYNISPEAVGADNFSDAGESYYSGYLAAAKKLGIANGAGDNKFSPESEITRQELITLLYRALGVLSELPSDQSAASLASYSDAGQIAGYAQEAFRQLAGAGVITGSNGKLGPQETSTRAQVAQILYNLLSK